MNDVCLAGPQPPPVSKLQLSIQFLHQKLQFLIHARLCRLRSQIPGFFRYESVHFVAKVNADAAIPEPANPDVDFAVVDFLEFLREVGHSSFWYQSGLSATCPRRLRNRRLSGFGSLGPQPQLSSIDTSTDRTREQPERLGTLWPRPWHNGVRLPLPRFDPMPLVRLRAPFDHEDWIFGPKIDGFRALAHIEDSQCRLVSRNRNAFRTLAMRGSLASGPLCGTG